MGKVKSWLRSMPLRKAFVSLVLVMAVLVAGISAVTIYVCVAVQERILESVTHLEITPPQQIEDEYNIVITDDRHITPGENGQLVVLSKEYQIQNLTDSKRTLYYAAKVAVILVPSLLFIIGTAFCAWLFYSVKLKHPLVLLLQSAERISQNELDFAVDYSALDEMGELCQAMDTMRSALLTSTQETWVMMEERRKLNASIAHDLRTPITVMKGYTEYLSHNVPLGRISENKLMETIGNLSLATDRLEQYVNQVRDVQALDALPVKLEACRLIEFFAEQKDAYSILTQKQDLVFSMNIEQVPDVRVMLDVTLTHRLIDNVISNALRFAKEKIAMIAAWTENSLTICLCDDGIGFSDEALRSATQPFYKENTENDHFGLGLSICNTLCEKQRGKLILSNQKTGGACIELHIFAENISKLIDQQ